MTGGDEASENRVRNEVEELLLGEEGHRRSHRQTIDESSRIGPRQSWRRAIYSRKLAERAGFESGPIMPERTGSEGYRAVAPQIGPEQGADTLRSGANWAAHWTVATRRQSLLTPPSLGGKAHVDGQRATA